MSTKPASRFTSEEAVSAVVVRQQTDDVPELLVVHEPIPLELLSAPVDDRLDPMLARLHDRDFLGAFVIASSILAYGEHGLARICADEAYPHVKTTVDGVASVAALRDLHEKLQDG